MWFSLHIGTSYISTIQFNSLSLTFPSWYLVSISSGSTIIQSSLPHFPFLPLSLLLFPSPFIPFPHNTPIILIVVKYFQVEPLKQFALCQIRIWAKGEARRSSFMFLVLHFTSADLSLRLLVRDLLMEHFWDWGKNIIVRTLAIIDCQIFFFSLSLKKFRFRLYLLEYFHIHISKKTRYGN